MNISKPLDISHPPPVAPKILLRYKRCYGLLFFNLNHKIMKHKTILASALITALFAFLLSCNNDKSSTTTTGSDTLSTEDLTSNQPEQHGTEVKPGEVEMTSPLNQEWVAAGKSIYELKCQSCHKLTDERLVGPGWKGISKRREPHWVMNMITNVDVMLDTDPEAQKLLEQCLVRMPNQNVSKDDSRKILEFMRSNDGAK